MAYAKGASRIHRRSRAYLIPWSRIQRIGDQQHIQIRYENALSCGCNGNRMARKRAACSWYAMMSHEPWVISHEVWVMTGYEWWESMSHETWQVRCCRWCIRWRGVCCILLQPEISLDLFHTSLFTSRFIRLYTPVWWRVDTSLYISCFSIHPLLHTRIRFYTPLASYKSSLYTFCFMQVHSPHCLHLLHTSLFTCLIMRFMPFWCAWCLSIYLSVWRCLMPFYRPVARCLLFHTETLDRETLDRKTCSFLPPFVHDPCILVHNHTTTHTHTHTHAHTQTQTHIHIYTYTHTHILLSLSLFSCHTHTHTHARAHTHMHSNTCARAHAHIRRQTHEEEIYRKLVGIMKERLDFYCARLAQEPWNDASKGMSICLSEPWNDASKGITLQHTAAHCNTLQHTATHCNTSRALEWCLQRYCLFVSLCVCACVCTRLDTWRKHDTHVHTWQKRHRHTCEVWQRS